MHNKVTPWPIQIEVHVPLVKELDTSASVSNIVENTFLGNIAEAAKVETRELRVLLQVVRLNEKFIDTVEQSK